MATQPAQTQSLARELLAPKDPNGLREAATTGRLWTASGEDWSRGG
jgi:hypothetical protein